MAVFHEHRESLPGGAVDAAAAGSVDFVPPMEGEAYTSTPAVRKHLRDVLVVFRNGDVLGGCPLRTFWGSWIAYSRLYDHHGGADGSGRGFRDAGGDAGGFDDGLDPALPIEQPEKQRGLAVPRPGPAHFDGRQAIHRCQRQLATGGARSAGFCALCG